MKQLFSICCLFPLMAWSQLNMNQIGYLDLVTAHNSDLSDIWGWVDASGNEYALVAGNDGTSVVSLADPSNPVEVFYATGMNSIWRDIKTWGDYAYVTTEAENGLLIIDLSTLPGNTNLSTTYYNGPIGNQWSSAHNLYIDENGICYIFGANRDNGGCIMLDVATDPLNPIEVGSIENWYTHDGMAKGDTLYMGHIEDGHFSVWDVSNKTNPVLLGQQFSPGNYAHNVWVSDDGDYLYTTDEISNGYLGEFDITDLTDIVELDREQSNPGMNVIPHNTHFMNNYLITSYYRDGVVVHDLANKGSMTEVAHFDTSPQFSGDGFNGCWGVYPWLPSGNIIASDIENGLYVLGVNYTRGCYLEGNVTNAANNFPINNVQITVIGETVLAQSNIVGDYSTGIAISGTYDVVYSHPAYFSDTIYGVNMVNGQITIQDAQLIPIATTTLVIDVYEAFDGITPVEGYQFVVKNGSFTYSGMTDPQGNLTFNDFYAGTYNVYGGKWGYFDICSEGVAYGGNDTTAIFYVDSGYADQFNIDFGWQVSGSASSGVWERADPIGTVIGQSESNPEDDSQDCGSLAYITGNGGGQAGTDDVDDANAILESPEMNFTSYTAPQIILDYWWMNVAGQVSPNDTLKFYMSDGIKDTLVGAILSPSSNDIWQTYKIDCWEYIDLSATVKLRIETADWTSAGGNIVEAGIDNFKVVETVSVEDILQQEEGFVYPNPTDGWINIELIENQSVQVNLLDITGKLISSQSMRIGKSSLFLPKTGVYLLQIQKEHETSTIKVIRN